MERAAGFAREYAAAHTGELIALIKALCAIPAPSHREERRAAFCKAWFLENGFEDVVIDAAQNVVCRVNCAPGVPVTVFMAHTDTVFPDLEPMPMHEENGRLYCPGVGDDTANLAALMLAARRFREEALPAGEGFLFVANACEEGLGNLKGARQLMADYAGRVREVISIDCGMGAFCNKAVGSMRYRVEVVTEGGHSFSDFGNRSAIHGIAELIGALYAIELPHVGDSKTTYNVGRIEGGTSVNTIAQQAEMLYEYRSDTRACLEYMQAAFERVIAQYRAQGLTVNVECIGERPCMGEIDPVRQKRLEARAASAIRAATGREAGTFSASTDCNIPFSLGIPAVATGAYYGGGAHTREEFIELASLPTGLEMLLLLLFSYLN